MQKLGLYIHIPFCKRKCNYCDFYSCAKLDSIKEYVGAIVKQISIEAPLYKEYEFDTIFLGGGTPSLLEKEDFKKLACAIKNNLNLTQGLEFSLEANPGTITKEKLIAYKENGVNRLSIGLQSSFDGELKNLGRIHTYDEFVENFKLARDCGFENISVDVMYSLPNQTTENLIATLEKICSLHPKHISSYCLKIEENTPFGKIKDKLNLPDEDEEYKMYISMCECLNKHGYLQYEISNFAKQGYESRHNLKYWQSEEYIGLGPSAHSFFNGKRYYYNDDLSSYISSLSNGRLPQKQYDNNEKNIHSSAKISKEDEYVMLKMRLSQGINIEEFKARFEKDFIDSYPEIEKYVKSGHVVFSNGAYSFTPKGFFVSNYILTDILSFHD